MKIEQKEYSLLVSQFYDDFIEEEYSILYSYFWFGPEFEQLSEHDKIGYNAQHMINNRYWYRDIKEYKLLNSGWRGRGVRKVTIQVAVHRGENSIKKYKDTLELVRKNGVWKIGDFQTGVPANLP